MTGRTIGTMALLVAGATAGLALSPRWEQRAPAEPSGPEPLALEVTYDARALQPGEVVLLTARVVRPAADVSGEAFGQPVRFFAAPGPARWQAILGIDVETRPGEYAVRVDAVGPEGGMETRTLSLRVGPKAFETRTLSVDPRFVDPPADAIPRIQREAARVAEVYGARTPERFWSGAFLAPVSGAPTSSFGRLSVFNGEPRGRHRGADFRAAEGTPVRAPNAGRVVLSDELYFAGGSVILDHGHGLFSNFAHLSKRSVPAGEMVEAGQVVGLAGATGRVTGPHLHWSVRVGDASVDPLSLMAVLVADAREDRPDDAGGDAARPAR